MSGIRSHVVNEFKARSDTIDSRTDKLAQAQAAIEGLKDGYTVQLQMDVAELSDVWAKVDQASPDPKLIEDLFQISHNLKGQAGSFGYDLVTALGASLCDLIRSDVSEAIKVAAIGHHVSVLSKVVAQNVVGDGGETGAKILAALSALSSDE